MFKSHGFSSSVMGFTKTLVGLSLGREKTTSVADLLARSNQTVETAAAKQMRYTTTR